eukprot:TRINITY_DN2050_c0_g1_i1.p1 TRINITY_DN2050_c0_g1~~TRINITY_DN2050_c0_g1_i1.p1  ORF type:complete len:102 (+),score=28.12 TRINITY_DN2050_c0_g1_i1:55-360(+)
MLLSPDDFIFALMDMYSETKEKGSVWFTMKRVANNPTKSIKKVVDGDEYCCLIRAKNSNKKISAFINNSNYIEFHKKLGRIMRGTFTNLERKKKQKRRQQS